MNNGDGYFITQIKNCIDEFYEFYFADIYISKKMYDKFLDKYRDVFSLINKYKEDAHLIFALESLTNLEKNPIINRDTNCSQAVETIQIDGM